MNQKKTVFIGSDKVCDRRKLDAQRTANYFLTNHYNLETNPKKADIIIIFTCGVTNEIANSSLNDIKKCLKYNGELIVAGCLPETDKNELDSLFTGKKFSAKEMEEIDGFFPNHKIKFNQIIDTNHPWVHIDETRFSGIITKTITRTKIGKKIFIVISNNILKLIFGNYYLIAIQFVSILYVDYCIIRVSQGCSNNCAYCSTKKAIGCFKSKPLAECVKEFKTGLENGYTKFILTGDDTGAYGSDINSSFPELLDAITKIEGQYQIDIHALNPIWVVKYAAKLEPILGRGKIRIISIPVQSGCNRILSRMHRFSSSEKMKEVLIKIKKTYPGLALDTHIIVGFPGETEDEFQQSLQFVKEVGFDFGSLIPLSIRPGTEIESDPARVSDIEIKRRIKNGRKYLHTIGYKSTKSMLGGIVYSKKR